MIRVSAIFRLETPVRRLLAAIPLGFGLLAAVGVPAPAAQPVSAPQMVPSGPQSSPKLVVLLVVDQMRADYVEKFGAHWTGGLRRLISEGAWFREAAYQYMTTVTCVGHSFGLHGAARSMGGQLPEVPPDRLDRTLASLIAHLDATVGRDRYVLALTADHGVSPVPEQMAALSLDAGRWTRLQRRGAGQVPGHTRRRCRARSGSLVLPRPQR
jgi:predicted AlkP superfamily pyrophosphatase or phosphodiesterase